MTGLLYSFYGDDFTGSTDVLERLALAGVKAALFLQPPTEEDLRAFKGLQAVGVAGDSRSQTPEWMDARLPVVFRGLKQLGAPVVHYKVCSTFDSSPQRGSIGHAMEIGRAVFHSPFVPVVVGAPHLRRFVWEGQLFAADPHGRVQRIDRHPMSRHPVTPMREENLRRHLAAQTTMPLFELHDTELETLRREVEYLVRASESGPGIVFDTVAGADLDSIGEVLWERAQRQLLFAVGSSGLTSALIAAWTRLGCIGGSALQAGLEHHERRPLLVVSGSCSAMTERQIRWALAHGFRGVPVAPADLLRLESGPAVREQVSREVSAVLTQGECPVVYTAMGQATAETAGAALGAALGELVREVLERTPIRRVVLCGGDTSSHAVQQLGVRALTVAAALQTGVPLCRAHGEGRIDGVELALKGGQVGSEDFFAVARDV